MALVLLPQPPLRYYILSSTPIDYQNELVAVWSERVKTDTTGIRKNDPAFLGLQMLYQDPEYLVRKRKYYKRKSKEVAA